MDEIKSVVSCISGHRSQKCYEVLFFAVWVACEHQPREPSMNFIVAETCKLLGGRSSKASSKALSRAARDIWDFGDRRELEKIYGRPVPSPPTPRELVLQISQFVCSQRP